MMIVLMMGYGNDDIILSHLIKLVLRLKVDAKKG